MTYEEIREIHRRHRAACLLDEPTSEGMPDGWQVVVRRWVGGGVDALIVGPQPWLGWALGGGLARNADEARRRARREVEEHLGTRTKGLKVKKQPDAGLVMALVSGGVLAVTTAVVSILKATNGRTTGAEAAVIVGGALLVMGGTFAWLVWRTR